MSTDSEQPLTISKLGPDDLDTMHALLTVLGVREDLAHFELEPIGSSLLDSH